MSFTLPTLNLDVNIFTGAVVSVPPRVVVRGNLAWGRRVTMTPTSTISPGEISQGMTLLLPAGTDIRDATCSTGADAVEVPAGTGRYYYVTYVDDVGRGFANEFRAALLFKTSIWPTPIP